MIQIAGKKRKSQSAVTEVIQCLQELEKFSEERQEEREMQRRRLELEAEERRQQAEWEMEERRRDAEHRHEERMNAMFMSFFREVLGRPNNYPPPADHQSLDEWD